MASECADHFGHCPLYKLTGWIDLTERPDPNLKAVSNLTGLIVAALFC